MSNPQNLWQIFFAECREILVDYFMPLIAVARCIRRHLRK
jgi:hypothetical protein